MPQHTVSTALIACTFGAAPSNLQILPTNMVKCGNQPAGNIMDHIPMVNIMPFGMCNAPANPAVIAATSAAMGTPTPAPCIPATSAPWAPGSATVMLGNMPALNSTSKCLCNWAGEISIGMPGQVQTAIA